MAKGTGVPIPLATARATADRLVAAFTPHCARIEIAGSVRRGRPQVNDLDLVIQPRDTSNLAVAVAQAADETRRITMYGSIWQVVVNGIIVDLYLARPEQWGMILLARTGSKTHNIKLAVKARRRGMALKYDGGYIQAGARRVACPTEQAVFHALGMAWREPACRE